MKPSFEELKKICPDIQDNLLRNHLERLDENYFRVFTLAQVESHIRSLAGLTSEYPAGVLFEEEQGNTIACTVLAYDYPAEFSLITGVLSATGFNILSGNIFTYARLQPSAACGKGHAKRRMIIDRFSGAVGPDQTADLWKVRFKAAIEEVIGHLEKGTDDSMALARSAVNEMVAARLAGLQLPASSILYPVAIKISNAGNYTGLRVLAQDTPAFLYAMSSALALQGLSIEQVRISTVDGRIQDEIDILDERGEKITDAGRIDTVKISVLLTKQFTYFLGSSPDPYAALCRFEKMLEGVLSVPDRREWVELLSTPEALQGLARLLGASDYVWEDFIRLQYETLLPILKPSGEIRRFAAPSAELEKQLSERLRKAEGFEAQCRVLNEIKDRELYLIDLEQILESNIDPSAPVQHPAFEQEGRSSDRKAHRDGVCKDLWLRRVPQSLSELGQGLNPPARLAESAKRALRRSLVADCHGMLHVKKFSRSLTELAETVVRSAAGIIFRELRKKFGVPRTVAGLEAQWAIFGLGKFGGEAIGYASDIELLLVFSDNGRTDGPQGMENFEYFAKAAQMLTEVIRAKREGIFRVDIRLRPYGESGPKACSLDSFCRYYGPRGPAHSYERLALVRLRSVAGNSDLESRIERLRDEFIYGAANIKFYELRELREKQLAGKAAGGRYNAKFSSGALVDLEYDIQLLQVMHGAEDQQLRTPSIHEALTALSDVGVLTIDEGNKLAAAYYFFRRLINGLRMLRGSARDLFLPPEDSIEFVHLARRMGYERGGHLEPQQQLRVDFETRTAVVRAFVERHFGRDSLPGKPAGNVADLILSDSVPPALREKILTAVGFKNTERAYLNLRALGGAPERQDLFTPLAVLVCDSLRQSVDPDRALNNWERYVRTTGDAVSHSPSSIAVDFGGVSQEKSPVMLHFEILMAQPKRLEILLGIFAASQFLADTLIRNPEFFNWATAPETLNRIRPRNEIENDLREFTAGLPHDEWLGAVRRFRCREILRIGTRDIFLYAPVREIIADLSSLAEAMVRAALEHFCLESGMNPESADLMKSFCILAFGKLGGRELNYSSDVDLLGVYDLESSTAGGTETADSDLFYRAMEQVGNYLSIHTSEGHAYRVDFRLRPYGRAGQIVYSLKALTGYYRSKAATWEIQALLKAMPVAGSEKLGQSFIELVRNIMREKKGCKEIIASVDTMREKAIKESIENGRIEADIKNGIGGIRDIEFLAQGLQLINCPSISDLITGNTLAALTLLGRYNLLPVETVEQLASDYEFLRRVEHCLQIFEDQQVHVLPESEEERHALAKRVLGFNATAGDFMKKTTECQARVRACFRTYLICR